MAAPALLLTTVWTAMGVLMWVLFPMLSSVFLPMCAIAPLACYVAARRRVPWYRPSLTTVVLLLATGFLLINGSWSRSPELAGRAVTLIIMMVLTLHAVSNTLPDLDEPPLRAMAVGALVGLAAGSAFLCLEVFSDQSLRRALIRIVPALQPNPSHVIMEGGHVARLAPYLPNASIAVLTLMLTPGALMVGRLGLPRAWRYVALATGGIAIATILASEHASSQVALLGACMVAALFRLRPKLALKVVVAGWVAANLAVVPAAWLLFSAGAHQSAWLANSARHRIVIWRYTVAQIHNAPLLGVGIGTGRAVHEARHDGQHVKQLAPGTPFELSTSLHSHNAYLQVWYETGAVGAAFVLALGLTMLWGLRALDAATQPYLAATFAACALMVATAYSIWAPWFLATLAMAAIFAALGAALQPRAAGPANTP
jgi:O-antigen ligase